MIDFKEHLYEDDPAQGHPDVRTRLQDGYYFFLGNGRIQAAVQIAPAGEGTPVGLLLMDPERLAKKREALSFDPQTGLEATMLRVEWGEQVWTPPGKEVKAHWSERQGVPAVEVTWHAGGAAVTEIFCCPHPDRAVLLREVTIRTPSNKKVGLSTGLGDQWLSVQLTPSAQGEVTHAFWYTLEDGRAHCGQGAPESLSPESGGRKTPQGTRVLFHHEPLDRYFDAARVQLPAAISASGRMDGSIWQYNREWVRDQAMVVHGLLLTGQHQLARTMLERLFTEFVTEEGDTVDSSVRRGPEEVELDQGGVLLTALTSYWHWTGDLSLARRLWPRVVAVAEFPLRPVFRDPKSGLLTNTREYWERHRLYGIQPGIELTHQLYASLGLRAAAELGKALGRESEVARWNRDAEELWHTALHHPTHSLVEGGRIIKRRGLDGEVQEHITPMAEAQLHPSVPLAGPGPHLLNPDTSCVLPVVVGKVNPGSPLARATLASMEELWNQRWDIGGYGRYHVSSEPDSPGPWPFASLFVARAYAEAGDGEKVWRVLRWLDSVPGGKSGAWFEFYGPRPSPPCPQVGVIPWTWAEMLLLLVHHVVGFRPGAEGITLRPHLLPGIDYIEGTFVVRGARVHVAVRRAESPAQCAFRTDGRLLQAGPGEASVAYENRDLHVEAIVL